MMADREGRLEDRPRRVKVEVFPYDDEIDVSIVNQLLDNLMADGFIQRYVVDKTPYIQITNFRKHQNPYHKEPVSVIPPNDGHSIIADATPCRPRVDPVQAHEVVALIPDSGSLIPDSYTNVRTSLERQPRVFTNTHEEIDKLVDYCTEVLNKLEGITTQTERKDRGALLKIAKNVPPSIVKQALADTQDANQRGTLKDAGAYFSARVMARCVTAGIKSPFAQVVKAQVQASDMYGLLG